MFWIRLVQGFELGGRMDQGKVGMSGRRSCEMVQVSGDHLEPFLRNEWEQGDSQTMEWTESGDYLEGGSEPGNLQVMGTIIAGDCLLEAVAQARKAKCAGDQLRLWQHHFLPILRMHLSFPPSLFPFIHTPCELFPCIKEHVMADVFNWMWVWFHCHYVCLMLLPLWCGIDACVEHANHLRASAMEWYRTTC